MHLLHPQKFVFNFSWDDCNTQEKFRENNGLAFLLLLLLFCCFVFCFFVWGGGGGAMGIMVYVKVVNNKLLDTQQTFDEGVLKDDCSCSF